MNATCVIGIGSPHGDDQAGWLVCDILEKRLGSSVKICKVTSPIDVIEQIDGITHLWLCDACQCAGRAGSVHRFVWPDADIALRRFGGTHDVDLGSALRLAERLGRLPSQVIIWGIECAGVDKVSEIASETRAAAEVVARAIVEELDLVGILQHA